MPDCSDLPKKINLELSSWLDISRDEHGGEKNCYYKKNQKKKLSIKGKR